MDVKGSLELLDVLGTLAVDYKAAMADGQFSLFDLPKFADLYPKIRTFSADAKLIPSELKNLDAEAVGKLVTALVDVVTKVLDAVPAPAVP